MCLWLSGHFYSLSEQASCNPFVVRAIQWKQIYCSASMISQAMHWMVICIKLATNNSRHVNKLPWIGEVKHCLFHGPEAKCDRPVKVLTAVSYRAGEHKQRCAPSAHASFTVTGLLCSVKHSTLQDVVLCVLRKSEWIQHYASKFKNTCKHVFWPAPNNPANSAWWKELNL